MVMYQTTSNPLRYHLLKPQGDLQQRSLCFWWEAPNRRNTFPDTVTLGYAWGRRGGSYCPYWRFHRTECRGNFLLALLFRSFYRWWRYSQVSQDLCMHGGESNYPRALSIRYPVRRRVGRCFNLDQSMHDLGGKVTTPTNEYFIRAKSYFDPAEDGDVQLTVGEGLGLL